MKLWAVCMIPLTTGFKSFEQEAGELELTMGEKRQFLEWMRQMVLGNLLNRDDVNRIYSICCEACSREERRREN